MEIPEADSYPTSVTVDSGLSGIRSVVVTPYSSLPGSVSASAIIARDGKFNVILDRETPSVTSVAWIAIAR